MSGSEPPPPYSPMGASDTVQSTIDRPGVPYIGQIPPLVDGSMVIMQGIVPSQGKSFRVTLSCGAALSGAVECALTVHHLFDEKSGSVMNRNSFLGGQWGRDEKWGLEVPCKPGFQFEMIILATKNDFKVALNGQHYCEFKHRTPIERVSHLVVEGDVMLNFVRHQNPPPASAPTSTTSASSPKSSTDQKTVTSQVTTVYQPAPVVVPVGHHHHHLLPSLLPLHHHHHRRHHHHGFGFGFGGGFGRHRRF